MSGVSAARVALPLAFLVGCATPPPEYGAAAANRGFGYSEIKTGEASYILRVVANSPQTAFEWWNRRAKDLCGGAEVRKNIFRADRPVVETTGYAVNPYNPSYGGSYTQYAYGALTLEGQLFCGDAPADAREPLQSGTTDTTRTLTEESQTLPPGETNR